MGAARSAAEGADIEPFSTLFRRPKNAKLRLRADGRAGAFARRGTERRRHSTAQLTRNFANRRQMRRGPRGSPSLTAATCTLDHVREVEGLREQQRRALPAFQQQGFLDPFRAERFANRRQMDRGPRLKFWLMFATVEGGEGAALRAAYIVVYTPPCGRWLAHISLRLKALSPSSVASMQSIVVSRASEHLYLLPSLVSSYAERSRSSPTISGDLSRTGPALKQRIDDTRARVLPVLGDGRSPLHDVFKAPRPPRPSPPPPFSYPPSPTSRNLSVPTSRFQLWRGRRFEALSLARSPSTPSDPPPPTETSSV
ncbi:hypothetical protein GGG16DRAFT_119622 [Schizophyllum commune]